MKAYLSDLPLKNDNQRSKGKLQKHTIKLKTEGHKQLSQVSHSNKISIKGDSRTNEGLNSQQKRKNHQRVNTEMNDRRAQRKGEQQLLNKTQSKTRLKTEMAAYNNDTLRVTLNRPKKQVEEDQVWGMVKDRLHNQTRVKKQQSEHTTTTIKKLLDLAVRAKERRPCSNYSSKNPEDNNESLGSKDIHHSMDLQVENLRQELSKEGRTQREVDLCEVLNQMVGYAKRFEHNSERTESRLLNRIRQLQQRNVRLMMLVNRLKREGVDVESFWTGEK